jgi:hypothetical protein
MTANPERSEKLVADLKRVIRDSEELLQELGPAAEEPPQPREQEVTMWILLIAFLVLSFLVGYLLWAKVAYAWPFQL